MAGSQRFELWEVLPSSVFKTDAIDHSANSPWSLKSIFFQKLEAAPGFEPGIKALQAHALPLGYAANLWCPEPDLNRHSVTTEGF